MVVVHVWDCISIVLERCRGLYLTRSARLRACRGLLASLATSSSPIDPENGDWDHSLFWCEEWSHRCVNGEVFIIFWRMNGLTGRSIDIMAASGLSQMSSTVRAAMVVLTYQSTICGYDAFRYGVVSLSTQQIHNRQNRTTKIIKYVKQVFKYFVSTIYENARFKLPTPKPMPVMIRHSCTYVVYFHSPLLSLDFTICLDGLYVLVALESGDCILIKVYTDEGISDAQ